MGKSDFISDGAAHPRGTSRAVARLVVCGDTGIAHLATAFGTRSVVLFGPTPPRTWGPRVDRHLHTVLWTGRRGDPHGARLDPGLADIEAADVVAAASVQLER